MAKRFPVLLLFAIGALAVLGLLFTAAPNTLRAATVEDDAVMTPPAPTTPSAALPAALGSLLQPATAAGPLDRLERRLQSAAPASRMHPPAGNCKLCHHF